MAAVLAITEAGGWVSPALYPKLWGMHWPCCSPLVLLGSDTLPSAKPGQGEPGTPGWAREAAGWPAVSSRGRPACVAPGRRLPPSRPADGFQMTAPSREAPVPPQAAAPACFLPLPPRPPRPCPAEGPGNASQSR